MRWATILAIAFCGIDFAGLTRLITGDERGSLHSILARPNWLILGAWLMGGAMNAIMTWWAVSLALINHNLGNELLSRAQLLHVVPVFVAVLVWMTRILIISSFVTAADRGLMSAATTVAGHRERPGAADRPSRPMGPPKRESAPVRSVEGRAEHPQVGRKDSQPPAEPSAVRPTRRPNGRPAGGPVVPRAPRGSRPSTVPLQMRRNPTGRRKSYS
jgi:hypothetical protein